MALLAFFSALSASFQAIRYKVYHKGSDKEVKVHIDPSSNLYIDEGICIPFVSGTVIPKEELDDNYNIRPMTDFRWFGIEMFDVLMSMLYILFLYYLIWGRNSHIINVIRENEENK